MAVYGAKLDPAPFVPYTREYIPAPDGGQLALGKIKNEMKSD